MIRHTRERGEGNLGCILWAVAFLLVAYALYMTVPTKMASAQLYDFMVDEAKDADRIPPPEIKKRILKKARELDLPLAEKDVTAERLGDRIRMKAKYTVKIDFGLGITYDWNFFHDVDRPIFYV
jgi:hypothetical protein